MMYNQTCRCIIYIYIYVYVHTIIQSLYTQSYTSLYIYIYIYVHVYIYICNVNIYIDTDMHCIYIDHDCVGHCSILLAMSLYWSLGQATWDWQRPMAVWLHQGRKKLANACGVLGHLYRQKTSVSTLGVTALESFATLVFALRKRHLKLKHESNIACV